MSHSLTQKAPFIRLAPWSETTRTTVSSSTRSQQLADLPVEVLVIVEDDVLVFVPGLVEVVLVVHVLPEGVLDPVDADLDEHEEVPGLVPDEPVHDLEPLVGHLVDLGQDLVAVLGPEDDVEDVGAEALLDLLPERLADRCIPCPCPGG